MKYVSNMKHGNVNLVNFMKKSLTDGCLVCPVGEDPSFEVLLFYFKTWYLKCKTRPKQTKLTLICIKWVCADPATVFLATGFARKTPQSSGSMFPF